MSKKPKFSINLTVHNKASILNDVLGAIASRTTGEWELVICLDFCTDDSSIIARQWSDALVKSGIDVVICTANNVFETRANNRTASLSRGDYLIFVQDDMIIDEHGWNERLIKPLEAFSDVVAVTGRTAHNWQVNPNSHDIGTDEVRGDRWSDVMIHCDHANRENTPRDVFAARGFCNRGPLAIHRSIFSAIGGFDEYYAPLSYDEHNLIACVRYISKNSSPMVVGFYSINWHTKPEWGGTRDENGRTRPFVYEADFRNARRFAKRWGETGVLNPIIENRPLP